MSEEKRSMREAKQIMGWEPHMYTGSALLDELRTG
jgi:hypothetical protein